MFFPKFPSTKLQDVNLDWLLKKICKLRGGTTNQVLAKASNADFDFKWVTGGGGGGTSDYNDLVNQPQINNVTLIGNLSGDDLGLLGSEALNDYRTAAAQDAIDATKQAKIAASGLLKGDGAGGVTAATAGTDYLAPAALMPYRTAAEQDVIDAMKEAAGLGLALASVGDLVRVNTVDANGKPTSWRKAPLCEVKTNPNMLDNWGFTNPVNQRGQTTWQNAGEYTVDRWKLTSGTASLSASGLTLNGTLVQIRETAIGMPVICSALLSDGSMITPTYDDSTKTYTITATGQTIKAVKLELGSEQTLAHLENGQWVLNEIPDYGEELRKCQRYLQRINIDWPIITGTASRIAYSVNLSPPMANNPTLVQHNTLGWYRYYNGAHIDNITSQTWLLLVSRNESVTVNIDCGDKNPTGHMIGYASSLNFLLSAET